MKVADLYRETAISITAKGLDIFAEMLVDPAAFADFVKSPAAVRTLQAVIAAGDRGKSLAAQALAAPDAVRLLADDGHWATAQPSIPVSAAENLVVGRYYANKKGIFGGVWENPRNRDGKVIGKRFHVWWDSQDLTDASGNKVFTFNEARAEVCKLPDGLDCPNDTAFWNGLEDGTGLGKRVIPPRELLHGLDVDGSKVRDQHLYGLRDEGDFRGTYTTDRGNSKDFPHYYWSCTEHRDHSTDVWATRFSDGDDDWHNRDVSRLSCRPCRVELAL